MAYKSLNNPEDALKDIDEALKLVEDSSAAKLKEQIIDQIKSSEMLSGIKQIEKQFDQLRMGVDNEEANNVIDNFEIDKFYEVISRDYTEETEVNKD
jgi:hypothetical protein